MKLVVLNIIMIFGNKVRIVGKDLGIVNLGVLVKVMKRNEIIS